MRTTIIILLSLLAFNISGQVADFQTGDVILYADTREDRFQQYTVDRENDLQGLIAMNVYLSEHGRPYCPVALDMRDGLIREIHGRNQDVTLTVNKDSTYYYSVKVKMKNRTDVIKIESPTRVFIFIRKNPFKEGA